MGYTEYEPISQKYHVPIVVMGFEPVDILQGVYLCVKQLQEGRSQVENQYTRSVRRDGNQAAQQMINEVFARCDRKWRGIGEIPERGLKSAE
jgi:hydrogenase expression/formation protein HypD